MFPASKYPSYKHDKTPQTAFNWTVSEIKKTLKLFSSITHTLGSNTNKYLSLLHNLQQQKTLQRILKTLHITASHMHPLTTPYTKNWSSFYRSIPNTEYHTNSHDRHSIQLRMRFCHPDRCVTFVLTLMLTHVTRIASRFYGKWVAYIGRRSSSC